MPNFTLQIDLEPFEALDQLALLARQDYNLGGSGDWFGEFRRGLHGVYARLWSLCAIVWSPAALLGGSRMASEGQNTLRDRIPLGICDVSDGLSVGMPYFRPKCNRMGRVASRFPRYN